MSEEKVISESERFANKLEKKYGLLMKQPDLAKLLGRSKGGLRYSLCMGATPIMIAFKRCSRKVGKFVYYPTDKVAEIIIEQGGQS